MELKNKLIERARAYCLRGLTAGEIGKLLDISPRTVHRYIAQSGCREISAPKTIHEKAFELSKMGYSYAEIAKKLRISKSTVYNWHRKRKQQEPETGRV
jgi:DNA-directed RNA polymerase specialized sigma24 family protein